MAAHNHNPCPLEFQDKFSKTTNQLNALIDCLSLDHLNNGEEGMTLLSKKTLGGCLWLIEDLVESLQKQVDEYFEGGETNAKTS